MRILTLENKQYVLRVPCWHKVSDLQATLHPDLKMSIIDLPLASMSALRAADLEAVDGDEIYKCEIEKAKIQS